MTVRVSRPRRKRTIDTSESEQSDDAASANVPMDVRSVAPVAPTATVADSELLRPSPQQSLNMLTLPLEATVRPPLELAQLTEYLQQLCPLPELLQVDEHFLPSVASYSELSKTVNGKVRTWTLNDVKTESRWQKANEAKTVIRAFQTRVEDTLDEHSEAIFTLEHLISFMAEMPEKVLFKLRHGYVALDVLTADRCRWGRPGTMVPTVITMQFSIKPPINRENSSAFFTLYLLPMAIMRSAVAENVDFKTLIEQLPAAAVPPTVKWAAAEIAQMESAKAKSAVLSLTGELLFALIVSRGIFSWLP